MKTIQSIFVLAGAILLVPITQAALFKTNGDRMFAAYFKAEADRLAADCLKEVKTLEDWKAHKGRYRREMHEMWGLAWAAGGSFCRLTGIFRCLTGSFRRLRSCDLEQLGDLMHGNGILTRAAEHFRQPLGFFHS